MFDSNFKSYHSFCALQPYPVTTLTTHVCLAKFPVPPGGHAPCLHHWLAPPPTSTLTQPNPPYAQRTPSASGALLKARSSTQHLFFPGKTPTTIDKRLGGTNPAVLPPAALFRPAAAPTWLASSRQRAGAVGTGGVRSGARRSQGACVVGTHVVRINTYRNHRGHATWALSQHRLHRPRRGRAGRGRDVAYHACETPDLVPGWGPEGSL